MMVTLPLTLSSMMKFFPVSSLTNFTSTLISTLSKSRVTYFLEVSFFAGWAGSFSARISLGICITFSVLTSVDGSGVVAFISGLSFGTASLLCAGVVIVLTFSSVPAIRAANAGPPTQSIIISTIMPPENRPGLIITGMNPKASFENILQQAAGYCTLRFAGLFNLPIPIRFAFGIGVSQIKECMVFILILLFLQKFFKFR